MRKKILAGNWKLQKGIKETEKFLRDLLDRELNLNNREAVIAPPFTSLPKAAEVLKRSRVYLASQNVAYEKSGAYTGEISPDMLCEIGCKYAIVGHSERRQFFGETDETVNKRVHCALENGLEVIFCIGETLGEREQDRTFEVVDRQVRVGLKGVADVQMSKVVIAYEPVWAIGTGKTATPDQAQEVHAHLRKLVSELYTPVVAEELIIQYGGSVKPANVKELMSMPDIDGALIGGASLDVDSFVKLVNYDVS